MKLPIKAITIASMGLIGAIGQPVAAQSSTSPTTTAPPAKVHSRGVIVLRPDADPAPAGPVPPPPVPTPVIVPVIKDCPRPFANPDVRLDDSAGLDPGFDRALAARLAGHRPVVVDLARPYRSGTAPAPALVPWFSEIKASGGSVETRDYCEGGRGGFGNWLSKLFGPKPGKTYRSVRFYNAVLHVNALDQAVTQIEFVPRSPGRRP